MYDIKGKDVILPALSFVSTANAIIYNGGFPAFCDVDEDTLCLDPDDVHNVIHNSVREVACIVPVNFGGMEAKEMHFDLPVVCDSAHRIDRSSHNDMTCYSFHPVKNLAMPTGGAIAYNGDLSKLKARRWCGITDRDGPYYDVKEIGWNYYMNEISAAIGLVQLEKLDTLNKRRVDIARRYHTKLVHPSMPYVENCSYQLYWILVEDRNKFMKKMDEAGIETGIHYKPIDRFSYWVENTPFDLFEQLPVTREIEDKLVSIPMHANLTDQDLDRVIKVANS